MIDSQKFNYILILNLSLADFLMGIYLLIISVKSIQFSGFYAIIDYKWRTSLECSIIGSLSILSSETSCFIMTIITAYRLYNVFNNSNARKSTNLAWKIWIVLAWLVSIVLALLPLFKATANYFTHTIWFSNQFATSNGWSKIDVTNFACRLASLSNQSTTLNGDTWESTQTFLNERFPDYAPRGEVGYYGETSVCMPRLYVSYGDQAWLYSFVIITFNFISFIFVAIGYIIVLYKTTYGSNQAGGADERSAQMQKRISRMIITDFACWVPICIMVYLTTGGVAISKVIYFVTAGVLLPINSAINPLLYSPHCGKLR